MSGAQVPGPMCTTSDYLEIDDGTMCRTCSLAPGPIDIFKLVGPQMSPTEPPLFLGPNQIYRADIQFAAARTRFDPAALAALINAEAAKRNGVWDANSAAGSSSAVGLTQFLVDSWEEMAATPGTYLNEVGKRKGLIDSDNYFFRGQRGPVTRLAPGPALINHDRSGIRANQSQGHSEGRFRFVRRGKCQARLPRPSRGSARRD